MVPIVRRLIHKGMPVYVGMVFLLAGPIINPVVMAATYTAFPIDPQMVLYRTLFAFIVATVVGIVLFFTQKVTPLKLGSEYEITHEQCILLYSRRTGIRSVYTICPLPRNLGQIAG
ncbi:permease [Brevibacillus halotolerans]|nr:permease [Brevibacillus halotolerans]